MLKILIIFLLLIVFINAERTHYPTVYIKMRPTISPIKITNSPTKSPIKITNSTQNSTNSTNSPSNKNLRNPTKSPVIRNPTKTPTTTSPTQYPTNPTDSPTNNPTIRTCYTSKNQNLINCGCCLLALFYILCIPAGVLGIALIMFIWCPPIMIGILCAGLPLIGIMGGILIASQKANAAGLPQPYPC
jgi:hypothetical protein